ncbi:MAG TPA: hypothetical protein VF670_05955 [Duganella sp.]|jgi:hypothetical protein
MNRYSPPRQRRAAVPAADQLGRDQLSAGFVVGLAVHEVVEMVLFCFSKIPIVSFKPADDCSATADESCLDGF